MKNVLQVLLTIAVSLLGTLFFFAMLGFVFMLAWNFVIPDTFHGPRLTIVQSSVMLFLASILRAAFGNNPEKPTAYVIKKEEK
jgi:ABC-type siderophore export system fused ATPase/permease subunit